MEAMQFLLDITWSPDGKQVSGTLLPLTQEDVAPFSGTLEFIARIEELLGGVVAGEERAKGAPDAST